MEIGDPQRFPNHPQCSYSVQLNRSCRVKEEVQKINLYSIDREQGRVRDGSALLVYSNRKSSMDLTYRM